MIERKLQSQLKRAMVLVLCFIVIFLLCGGMFLSYIQKTKNEAIKDQVILETEEYKTRILKQLDADFQTLSTLSVLIGEYADDRSALAQKLQEVNENNNFLTIVYYDSEGEGVIATRGKEPVDDAGLWDLSAEGQQVVMEAMEGEGAVSQMFESEISNNQVFVYSVPVYKDDRIIGALAASDHIEIFSDIISGNTVLGGGGYIHLLDAEGSFLVKSSKTIVEEDVPSIYEGPYLSESSRQEVKEAIRRQKRIFSIFTYRKESYPFLLEPVGVNEWYLLCVNTGEGLAAGSSGAIFVVQMTFIAILTLITFLMLYGYRLLHVYNRELVQLAYCDSLTGAENLFRFRQRLRVALETAGGSVAVMNIRQFAFINEIFGEDKANRLLCQVKEALDTHLEEKEFFCRDARARFYLFLRTTDSTVLRSRLLSLMEDIAATSEIGRYHYELALYCGVAQDLRGGNPEKTADRLLTNVLFALSSAKEAHGNYVHFFDEELHKQEELENYVESHMQQAIQKEEFKLFLQPKKNLTSGEIEAAEALVRWKTEEGRMIYPDQFIPLFEKNGFCVKLDLYMFEQVCRRIRLWLDRGLTPISISVNQSKLLFMEEDYVEVLTGLVRKYEIPSKLITLEVLEGLALENPEDFNARIEELQGKGFRISLDDFGSGFSSLNTLNKLRIDELKLDRDFLLNISRSEGWSRQRGILILEQIIHMAKQLGISTVMEGVETPEDENMVKNMGCDIGQGYLYSRPISGEEFDEKFIR